MIYFFEYLTVEATKCIQQHRCVVCGGRSAAIIHLALSVWYLEPGKKTFNYESKQEMRTKQYLFHLNCTTVVDILFA